jgi:hypothetical protein
VGPLVVGVGTPKVLLHNSESMKDLRGEEMQVNYKMNDSGY